MAGFGRTDAATASLLLTLEGVAMALMAWFIFHENFDRRVALDMACLVAGAGILGWSGQPTLSGLLGPLAIIGACAAWGLDNNLTRRVSLADPTRLSSSQPVPQARTNSSRKRRHVDSDQGPRLEKLLVSFSACQPSRVVGVHPMPVHHAGIAILTSLGSSPLHGPAWAWLRGFVSGSLLQSPLVGSVKMFTSRSCRGISLIAAPGECHV